MDSIPAKNAVTTAHFTAARTKPDSVKSAAARRAPKSAAKSGGPGSRRGWRRVLKALALLVLALVLLPIFQVGCVRFVNPPGTPLMALRFLEAKLHGNPAPVRYRWLDWRALPDDFLRSVWVSEDARFFRHRGFDWIEVQAAMAKSEKTGRAPRGTSTITMQCARSLFLWQGRSYVRKTLEAYYTFWMETLLSKRRIFELHANVVELGDGIYGLAAASEFWFRKPPAQLSREECALLAAMLPAPRRWNPRAPSRRLAARQERALREMGLLHWPAGVR